MRPWLGRLELTSPMAGLMDRMQVEQIDIARWPLFHSHPHVTPHTTQLGAAACFAHSFWTGPDQAEAFSGHAAGCLEEPRQSWLRLEGIEQRCMRWLRSGG